MSVDVSAREAIRAIPGSCLKSSLTTSSLYLLRDVVLFALLGWAILAVNSWWLALPLAFLMGSVLTGLFVVGHDCGHRSFTQSAKINDVVGEVATALTLWPFQVWRLSHDIHHRHTHNIAKDIAWIPFTAEEVERSGPVKKAIYVYTRSVACFLGSWYFTFYCIHDALRGRRSQYFRSNDAAKLQRSIAFTALVAVAYIGASYMLGGWYGLLFLWLMPQIVFQYWLSTFTFFHHTHPDERFLSDDEWTFGAQLRKTIHVDFPAWAEWLCHDINWHVPHHACVGIPHYHLREAHRALKSAFPFVREERLSWDLVKRVTRQCQVIEGKDAPDLDWLALDAKGRQTRNVDPTPTTLSTSM